MGVKIFAENKKAYFDYEILEKFEAGISLLGQEVKSIKAGKVNLAGSYVILRGEEAFWVGAKVPAYQPKNAPADYEEERAKKLLLKKSEIRELIGKTKQRGLTLMPLKVYTLKRRIKLEFGLAKGKKKADKREALKKHETKREMEQELKTRG